MSDRILAVQGDQLPRVKLTITDENNEVVPIAGCTGALVYMRKVGGSDVKTIVPTVDVETSKVEFDFSNNELTDSGDFEIEIELDFSGKKQTIYKPIKMRVRPQFA